MSSAGCAPSVPVVESSGDSTGDAGTATSGGVTTLTMPSTGGESSTTVGLDGDSSSSGMISTTTPPDETTSTGPDIDETTSTGPDVDPTTGFTTADTDPGNGTEPETGGVPLPNGSQCVDDDECQSMQCYQIGLLGGICGECDEDADCPGGG